MKKLLPLFLLLGTCTAKAQQILSIQIFPSSPTTNDTVWIYINCQYPNTSCDAVAYFSQAGNVIYGNSFHCMGMLATICTDMDTIKLNPQPAGNYTLYYTLDAGYGLPTCTPGFQPYDYDTVYFTVSQATGMDDPEKNSISVYPNPAQEILFVNVKEKGEMEMLDELGKDICKMNLSPGENSIPLKTLPDGIYFIIVHQGDGTVKKEKITIIK